jgi:hypothetical protein
LSDASKAICIIPSIATIYSAANLNSTTSAIINGTLVPDYPELYDKNLMVDHVDTGDTCTFGMSFKSNHHVILDNMQLFIHNMVDQTPFVNNLIF